MQILPEDVRIAARDAKPARLAAATIKTMDPER